MVAAQVVAGRVAASRPVAPPLPPPSTFSSSHKSVPIFPSYAQVNISPSPPRLINSLLTQKLPTSKVHLNFALFQYFILNLDLKFELCSAAPTHDSLYLISFGFGALQKAQNTYFHTSKISFCLTKIEISIQWSLGRPDLV